MLSSISPFVVSGVVIFIDCTQLSHLHLRIVLLEGRRRLTGVLGSELTED